MSTLYKYGNQTGYVNDNTDNVLDLKNSTILLPFGKWIASTTLNQD